MARYVGLDQHIIPSKLTILFHGQIPVRGGNFVRENIGAFDAPFFTISPKEAECMDPQHRRMLEVAYHALEDGINALTIIAVKVYVLIGL